MRALIVSYAFPPVGGAGVQRVLKLVKYLPSHGVTPAVLTVKNPSVPLADHSLETEVPEGVEVLRAPTLEPSYRTKELAWQATASKRVNLAARLRKQVVAFGKSLLVPDPQVLWLPGAGRALLARLVSRNDDVLLISGPPFSQFLLAFVARLRTGTAVVLDYRDEWATTRTIYEMGGSERAGATLERSVLRSAHGVVTATEAFRRELLRRFDFLDPRSVTAIPNGYDPDDFPEAPPEPPEDRFVLTYVGTVFRLTSARPLLEAVRAPRTSRAFSRFGSSDASSRPKLPHSKEQKRSASTAWGTPNTHAHSKSSRRATPFYAFSTTLRAQSAFTRGRSSSSFISAGRA
jgi:glycosyltransferase involved in cell wall biosynthesis